MLPLTFSTPGTPCTILRVGGKPEIKKHLEDLGFVAGGNVEVISETAGNLVVNVKNTRIAISKELAGKIMTSDNTI